MNNVISRVEIEEWLRDISYIILDLNIAVQNSERLAENKYDFEIEIKRHGFFKHHWYQLRFISIIQLCKLLSENSNEKRSFHKLFNRLERDSYDPDLTELLLSNKFENSKLYTAKTEIIIDVQEYRNKISEKMYLINKIIQARDKFYAHKDPGAGLPSIEFGELKFLAALSTNIFNQLQYKLFFTTLWLDELDDWNLDYVFRSMSELRKSYMDPDSK